MATSEGIIAARRIQICLFLLELTLAFSIIIIAHVLLNVLPISLYWASGICSTLAVVWLIKSVVGAIETLRNRVTAYDGSNTIDETLRGNEKDDLEAYTVLQEGEFDAQSISENCITCDDKNISQHENSQTNQFLVDVQDEKNEPVETMAFHLLAVLITVLLQFVIRVLVIVQNIRRSRGRAASHASRFSHTPFTVGRNLSSSGASFYIFSFLNRWLEYSEDNISLSHDRGDEIAIKEVSFDRVSVGSSFVNVYPPRRHPSARSQLSWIGLSLNDIDVCVNIRFQEKKKLDTEGIVSNVTQSISLRFKLDSIELGVFPFVLDWCKGGGMYINAITFSNFSKCGNRPTGLHVSASIGCTHLYRYSLSQPERSNLQSKITLVSWDAAQSSLHLHTNQLIRNYDGNGMSMQKSVSLIKFPSGYAVLHGNVKRKIAEMPSRVCLNIGNFSCKNTLAVGINIENIQPLLSEVEEFLQIYDWIIRHRPLARGSAAIGKKKIKPSLQYHFEVIASISFKIYTLQFINIGDDKRVNCFSLETSHLHTYLSKDHDHATLVACDFILRHDEFSGDVIDEFKVTTSKPIFIKRVNSKLISRSVPDLLARRATVGFESVLVRMDEPVVNNLTSVIKELEEIKYAITSMQAKMKKLQRSHVNLTKVIPNQRLMSSAGNSTIDRIEISCESLDVIIDLPASSQRSCSESMPDGDTVRVEFVQHDAFIVVSKNVFANQEGVDSSVHINQALSPEQLFYSEVEKNGYRFFINVSVARIEGLVTFSPHSSLPVITDNNFSLSEHPEVYYYLDLSRVRIMSIVPSNLMPNQKIIDNILSKLICVSFDSLKIQERYNKNAGIDESYGLKSLNIQQTPDNMAANFVTIIKCSGSICLVDEINKTMKRKETIVIQFYNERRELELLWSPIMQWHQVSCSNKIQRALALLTASSTKITENTRKIMSSHETNIHIRVEPDVTANILAFVGTKTKARIIMKGGISMSIISSKFPCPYSQSLRQFTKPNIFVQANHVAVHLNDITSPIFDVDGITFRNFSRMAHTTEIDEYTRNSRHSDMSNEDIVRDHAGHPLKEIFELNLNAMSATFPPVLHFGEAIEDFVLLPKALFDGLNKMKQDYKKQKPKYQMMSIKSCILLLDVSLKASDPDLTPSIILDVSSSPRILRDEFRILFHGIDLSIERNVPPKWTQDQINDLDEDNTMKYAFSSTQGGLMGLSIKKTTCALYPLTIGRPLAHLDTFSMNGYLYLAGICPTNPGVHEGKLVKYLLFCHHRHVVGDNGKTFETRPCRCRYGVQLYSSGIPVKVYTDCRFNIGQLHIVYGSVMNSSIPRFMECIQRMLPPPPKSSSQESIAPLPWWDNIRYFIHGPIFLSADEFSLRWLLDSHTMWNKSTHLTCDELRIRYNVGSFEVDATILCVSIPGVPYDTSVHPSAKTIHIPDHTTCEQFESKKDFKRHPLLFIPSFKSRFQFAWEMSHPGVSTAQHHSIYMKPEALLSGDAEVHGTRDKYFYFRSDGVNIRVLVELQGKDGVGVDNWIALRTDVLPWLTHINSTLVFVPDSPTKKSESFPKFRRVSVKLSIREIKLVTWFADEEKVDGLCVILRRVKYISSINGLKEIILDGSVKAGLLSLPGFDGVENIDVVIEDNIDARSLTMNESKYPLCQGGNTLEINEQSFFRKHEFETAPFSKLHELTSNMDELDFVVITDQIDIRNQSMVKILSAACDDVDGNRNNGGVLQEKDTFDGVDESTWSILVARCRLLWTIAIRDSIMTISKDLIYTIGFMKSQQRQSQLISGVIKVDSPTESYELPTTSLFRVMGENISRSISTLDYLLDEGFNADSPRQEASVSSTTSGGNDPLEQTPSLPTLNIHFSNPQVQLHSIATGGSIILAMESAEVETRKFVHLFVPNLRSKSGNVAPSDLLIKTEQTYILTNMEAYSHSTRVDINVGLPWLEVCSAWIDHSVTQKLVPLKEWFGINESVICQSNDSSESTLDEEVPGMTKDSLGKDASKFEHHTPHRRYPPHLRSHEAKAFEKSGLLRPILDKFTFQSRQLFHRPPIHYSTQELIQFLKQGLVVGQNEAAVDDTELHIDLLNFNLDSYQFKTAIDVIRNVLLEAPRPYRRRESIDQENLSRFHENSSNIESAAAARMLAALRDDSKHQGKKGRQILRSAAMELMKETEDKIALNGDDVFRRISYRLSKLQSCIRSDDEIDDVQIDFTGFLGQHDYSTDGSVLSQFSLEDLRASSSRPSPDAINFLDPTSIVKSVLGNERSPCVRCNQFFNPSMNDSNSCVFHFGVYKYGEWTCCKSKSTRALGCKSGPHSGKERAAVIRVQTLPRIVDGISLYSHFEVNLFPGIPHKLVLQISKSISRLLMSYFFVEDDDDDDLDTIVTMSDDTSAKSDSFSTHFEFSPKPMSRKKAMLIGGKGTPYSGNKRATNESLAESLDNKNSSTVEAPKKKSEIVFVKVWRVGYVDVDISLGGFKRLPLASLDICVPAYSKAYEIGTWEFLGKKYLSHLVREVLKSGASSGLDKFRRKMMGSSPNPASTDSGQRRDFLDSSSSFDTSSATPRMPQPLRPPALSADSVSLEPDTARLWSRPKGASDILGAPMKKKRSLFSKHSR